MPAQARLDRARPDRATQTSTHASGARAGPEPEPPVSRAARAPADSAPERTALADGANRTAPAPAAPERATRDDTALSSERLADELAELTEAPTPLDADRRAFAAAHAVHFGGGTPDAALAAWDGYLARFPAGRFVPEARFNRAITLLRLGRDDDARAALRPFASGAYEGMRAREAARLLDALDRGTLRR